MVETMVTLHNVSDIVDDAFYVMAILDDDDEMTMTRCAVMVGKQARALLTGAVPCRYPESLVFIFAQ